MSHGEHWIVPLNYFFIVATLVIWAFSFPLWTMLFIAIPIALVLMYFATDKYGGMQVVMLVAPACLIATAALGKKYQQAATSGIELNIGDAIVQFVGTILITAVGLIATMTLMLGVTLIWKWSLAQIGFSHGPDRTTKVDEHSQRAKPDTRSDSKGMPSSPDE